MDHRGARLGGASWSGLARQGWCQRSRICRTVTHGTSNQCLPHGSVYGTCGRLSFLGDQSREGLYGAACGAVMTVDDGNTRGL